jgi:hypothetical protein
MAGRKRYSFPVQRSIWQARIRIDTKVPSIPSYNRLLVMCFVKMRFRAEHYEPARATDLPR